MTADQAISQLKALLHYEQLTEEALSCSEERDKERKAVLHQTEANIEALKLGIEALGGTITREE